MTRSNVLIAILSYKVVPYCAISLLQTRIIFKIIIAVGLNDVLNMRSRHGDKLGAFVILYFCCCCCRYCCMCVVWKKLEMFSEK